MVYFECLSRIFRDTICTQAHSIFFWNGEDLPSKLLMVFKEIFCFGSFPNLCFLSLLGGCPRLSLRFLVVYCFWVYLALLKVAFLMVLEWFETPYGLLCDFWVILKDHFDGSYLWPHG